jgi:hypothetical protein
MHACSASATTTMPHDVYDAPVSIPTPDEALEALAVRDWVWAAIHTLQRDDRTTLMLRYFSRCQ